MNQIIMKTYQPDEEQFVLSTGFYVTVIYIFVLFVVMEVFIFKDIYWSQSINEAVIKPPLQVLPSSSPHCFSS